MIINALHYSCIINAPIAEVYAFHTDTQNLPTITPPWIHVTIDKMDIPMVQGSRVVLQIKRYGITTRWEMEIEEQSFPCSVIDRMVSGPFPFFRHQRLFSFVNENETRMEETLTIALPFGWLGNLIFPLVKKDMDKMFAYRHNATQNALSNLH